MELRYFAGKNRKKLQKLSPDTRFVGQDSVFLKTVDSTNDYLKKELQSKMLNEGFLVAAEYQSKGRGQKTNVWLSEPGENALFSIYLKPGFLKTNRMSILSFVIALGVRAAVQQLAPREEVRVKWPNDILVGEQKVAGILIENIFGSEVRSVVGVGINVNQTEFDSNINATSLKVLAQANIDIMYVIHLCCEFIEKYYHLAKQGSGLQQIHGLYVSQLYKLDEHVNIEGRQWTVTGVDFSGKLEVNRAGERRKIVHNEVQVEWNL